MLVTLTCSVSSASRLSATCQVLGKLLTLKRLRCSVDLQGYSEEYQDHYTTLSVFRVSNQTATTDEFLRGVSSVQDALLKEWEISPEKARLSSNFIDAGFKVCCLARRCWCANC